MGLVVLVISREDFLWLGLFSFSLSEKKCFIFLYFYIGSKVVSLFHPALRDGFYVLEVFSFLFGELGAIFYFLFSMSQPSCFQFSPVYRFLASHWFTEGK